MSSFTWKSMFTWNGHVQQQLEALGLALIAWPLNMLANGALDPPHQMVFGPFESLLLMLFSTLAALYALGTVVGYGYLWFRRE